MNDNVIEFTGQTRIDLTVEEVALAAVENCPETLITVGIDQDGDLCIGATMAHPADALMLLEKAKAEIVELTEIV